MATRTIAAIRTAAVEASDFDALLGALKHQGYQVKGPVLRDSAVVYDDLGSTDEMPIGWVDVPEPARYRLTRRDERSLFGYTVGANPWKAILHPPDVRLWSAVRDAGGFHLVTESGPDAPLALVGVRACDLAALNLLDRVLLGGSHADPIYAARRSRALIVAVNCTRAGSTCFCAAMGTGPAVGPGADLVITELLRSREHRLIVSVESERGAEVMEAVPHEPARDTDIVQAKTLVDRAKREAGPHRVNMTGMRELLLNSLESPCWDDVAARCLTCGNCTNVCPTCFCTSVHDTTDVHGAHAERTRVADSCFTMAYSYATGGSVRYSPSARYRQWLVHKFATWVDQFGSPGCVGCGRCLTWCPVGIDVTQVLGRIRRSSQGRPAVECETTASAGRKEVSDANAPG